ncbi:hypothetical protein BGZ98_008469 [Dissophora globulifera]|nr:hypothetical protein BGZ98_008469 [Dissophora globulifera]
MVTEQLAIADTHMMEYTPSMATNPRAKASTLAAPELQDHLMMQYTMTIAKSDPHAIPADQLFEKLSQLQHQPHHHHHNSSSHQQQSHSLHRSPHVDHNQHHHYGSSSSTASARSHQGQNHSRSRSRSRSRPAALDDHLSIDTHLRERSRSRSPQAAIRDILKSMDHHQEMEDELELARRHQQNHFVNMDLLQDQNHNLKQAHGNANLRHSS